MQLVSILRNAAGRLGVDFGRPDYPPAQAVVLLDPETGAPYAASNGVGTGLTDTQLRASSLKTESLGVPTVARQIAATSSNTSTALTATCRRISIKARTADVRYAVGVGAQTANATTSHYLEMGERLDIAVPVGAHIAVIRDTAATVNAVVCITELA